MAGRQRTAIPISALVAVALWGGSFPGVSLALSSFHPVGLTALRMVLGTLLVAAILRVRKQPLLPRRADWPVCALLGVILGVHLSIQAYGLLYTSAIHTGWIIGFTPVTIAIGAHLFLRQRLGGKAWAGVALATGGVLLVTLEAVPDLRDAHIGDLIQLSSCLTWTLYTLLSIGVVRRSGALSSTGFAMAVAAVILLAWSLRTGLVVETPGVLELTALFFLGLFCSGLALTLWVHAQALHGPQVTALTLYAEPFFVLAFAALLLGEAVQPQALVGGLVVLSGVWLASRGRS
jgi:drug/metabolite transporter (DMT)-like permease